MTASERLARTEAADQVARAAFASVSPPAGVALVAVGGYGRGELSPFSDLDLLLVHRDDVDAGEWASEIWYPLWDCGRTIDHSVRTVTEVLDQANGDIKVALGLLDLRHVAGEPALAAEVRQAVLAAWRRSGRQRLTELRELTTRRWERVGEVAHMSLPDLKEGAGGIRDATILRALRATWLVDVPTGQLEETRLALLDVRDVLHDVAGRGTERITPELWEPLGAGCGVGDPVAAQRYVRQLARDLTHLSRTSWRRAEAVLMQSRRTGIRRRPQLEMIGGGLALANGEVVLAGSRAEDPLLLLRAAAEAAERGAFLEPTTVAKLLAESPVLPQPWPLPARQLLVRLLAAGPGLLAVWETLEDNGATSRWLPEWDQVRLLPHASVVHRFTVDRHMIETCIEASRLIRRVSRPDLMAMAALLHDIGKGEVGDHSVTGERLARQVALRTGFDAAEADQIAGLVRWHLLLPETATTRDPDDPATLATVTEAVGDREQLHLLAALTEADARATSEKAWTRWRAGLIHSLVARADAALADRPWVESDSGSVEIPIGLADRPDEVVVRVEPSFDGAVVTVLAADRVGLLADVAAVLATQRASVLGARVWTEAGVGVSVWQVDAGAINPALFREQLAAARAGRLVVSRPDSGPGIASLAAAVTLKPAASDQAAVLEVRVGDRRGVVYHVCSAIADLGLTVRSAHVNTLGPQAVDVFYLQDRDGNAPEAARAQAAVEAVSAALTAGR